MRWLADVAYLLAGLIYLPIALYHSLILGKNRRGWGQRFGAVPTFDPNVPRIWIHAVSLGEINATPRLVAALRERLPEADIVLSTTTDTPGPSSFTGRIASSASPSTSAQSSLESYGVFILR